MNKLTDSEIVKALEICLNGNCEDCMYEPDGNCRKRQIKESINIIKSQKAEKQVMLDYIRCLEEENKKQQAEIEELKADKIIAERHEKDARELYKDVVRQLKTDKSEAIKELREKCIEHQDFHKGDDGVFRAYISIEDLDNIISNL